MHLSTKMDDNISLPILLIHDDALDLDQSLPPFYGHAHSPKPLSGYDSAGCEEVAAFDEIPSIGYHSYRLRARQTADGPADL